VIVYKDRVVRVTCPKPPTAYPVSMKLVEPTAIEDKYGIVWVGMTPKHYENLAENMSDMLRFIRNQRSIVEYFKKCINEPSE
jgi:hypothetical protein